MRQDWDRYFLDIAEMVATRATCDRAHVGCVIVRPDHSILSTGYNGSEPGEQHCDDVGHLMVNKSCQRTTHSEDNAIRFAEKHGNYDQIEGSTIYITHSPCTRCMGKLVAAGIKRIIYKKEYSKSISETRSIAERCGIILQQIDEKTHIETFVGPTNSIPNADYQTEDTKKSGPSFYDVTNRQYMSDAALDGERTVNRYVRDEYYDAFLTSSDEGGSEGKYAWAKCYHTRSQE